MTYTRVKDAIWIAGWIRTAMKMKMEMARMDTARTIHPHPSQVRLDPESTRSTRRTMKKRVTMDMMIGIRVDAMLNLAMTLLAALRIPTSDRILIVLTVTTPKLITQQHKEILR